MRFHAFILSGVSGLAVIAALSAPSFAEPTLPATVTVTASPVVSTTTDTNTEGSAAFGESQIEEVRVVGERKQDVMDLKKNDIRTSSVMSQAEIAKTPAGSIVDVVSRLPGVTAYSDMGNGMAATGEHEFITVRGMDSSYNAFHLNGVEVPIADPDTRALSLRMLSPYGIASVDVNKAPIAEDDGAAIGGIVNFNTPSAYDFEKDHLEVSLSGNLSFMAADRGANYGGGAGQIEYANTFGANNQFGLYVSAYYDTRASVGESVESLGYAATYESESDVSNYRLLEHGLSAYGARYDYYENQTRRYGATIDLDYKTENAHYYVRSTYGRYKNRGNDNQFGIMSSLYGEFTGGSDYEDGVLSGLGAWSTSYYQTRDADDQLFTVKAGGENHIGRLTVDYNAHYGLSDSSTPYYIEASFYEMPTLTGSASFDLSDPENIKITTDSDETSEFLFSGDTADLWKYQGNSSGSRAKLYGLQTNVRYDVGYGPVHFIKAGINANSDDRYQYKHYFFHDNGNYVVLDDAGSVVDSYQAAGPSSADLPGRVVKNAFDGNAQMPIKAYDRTYFTDAVLPNTYKDLYSTDGNETDNPGAYDATDYYGQTVYGKESIFAAYVETELTFGDVTVTPGLRYEYTNFHETHWVEDEADDSTGYFTSTSRSYDEFLPNINVTWRPSDSKMVYHASVRRSFARPAFGLLAQPETVSYNDITGEVAAISKGNPNLKPVEATNYDISAEYYGPRGMLIEGNVYYKTISNFIFTADATGDDADANSKSVIDNGVTTSMPSNGGGARLLGMEMNIHYPLPEQYMPKLLSGLGVDANMTWQNSVAVNLRSDHYGRKTWLPRSPGLMYNLALDYAHNGITGNLSYQYVGKQLLSLTSYNMDAYLQPGHTLNLNVGYQLNKLGFSLSVDNLLDDPIFYKTFGKSKKYLGTQSGGGNGSYVKTGPTMRFTIKYKI